MHSVRLSSVSAEPERRGLPLIWPALSVTAFFMLAEIVVGYQFNVLSLVADSYQ